MEENISIGTLLRSARTKKKIQLEDVASKTKININILRALEEDDIKNLPNMAYLKGFVKNYARAIGLDVNQAQECLLSTFEIKKPAPVEELPSETETQKIIKTESILEKVEKEIISNIKVKENIITFVQNFFTKKIILSLSIIVVVIAITSTVVNWFAKLNFEKETINKIEQEHKEGPKVVTAPNLKLKSEEKNILEMDASKKFAQEILEQKETKQIASTEIVKKKEPTSPPVIEVKPEVTKEQKKIEKPKIAQIKKEEKKAKEIKLPQGVLPFKKFRPAPLNMFSIKSNSEEASDPSILPPNFKAAVLKDKQNVFVTAVSGDTWISYQSDEKPIKRFVLKQGRRVLIKGDLIKLFMGNYKVAKVFYNNELVEIKENRSGVKSLIFPQEAAKDLVLPLFPSYKGQIFTPSQYMEKMAKEESN